MRDLLPFQDKELLLRPFEPEDIPNLHEYLAHPQLIGRRYIPWSFSDIVPLSKKTVEAIYTKWSEGKKSLVFAIYHKGFPDLLGHSRCDWEWDTYSPSVEVVISPPYQRKGYGTKVLNLLIDYLFKYTPAQNINCWIADWNIQGRNFAQSHGFKEVGRMRRVGIRQGEYYDFIVMDILRDEWKSSQEAK